MRKQNAVRANPFEKIPSRDGIFLQSADKKLAGYPGFFRAKIVSVQALQEKLVEHRPNILAIDEAQFLFLGYDFFDFLVNLLEEEKDSDFLVMVSGLNLDADGRSFGQMPEFMAKADEIYLLNAICVKCGQPAISTQKKPGGSQKQIEVGGENLYEARCRKCFIKQSLLPHH